MKEKYDKFEIETAIFEATGLSICEIHKKTLKSEYTLARKALYYLLFKNGYRRIDISRMYGISPSAAIHSRREIEKRIIHDRELKRIVMAAEIFLEQEL